MDPKYTERKTKNLGNAFKFLQNRIKTTFPNNNKLGYHILCHWQLGERHYHDVIHLYRCLQHFDAVKTELQNPNEVELALWCHDAIYDTTRNDNERESALLGANIAYDMGLSQEGSQRIFDMIKASDHKNVPNDNDTKYFVDIDLAILGSDRLVYKDYEMEIRLEYMQYDDKAYKEGRKKVLEQFENRIIYNTFIFYMALETFAKQNLRWALKQLEPQPPKETNENPSTNHG